ncbi:MaoC/PaaZ C-terminal domain-containing protein [Cryptosporangium arvum]|uniref:Acyl dehydratase n=1 Tax=Cryptosporangium arvum DSM 44712 TaxID=927661 RepID=A0A011AKB9_9ACTN|nr:MaoC/PaaZ C-terminal domain-containing protein [Cryptosporangium arvum]EXG82416.1 acyl dehydratase [Cryptosporangium arvum DSM 44712]
MSPATAGDWAGRPLGDRTVRWTERDAILYALAVGARPDQLDLVYEKHLRVLPPFALTLAQWAPDALGSAGAFDVGTTLHGAQRLTVLEPLPPAGELTLAARVGDVWDKGSAAIFDVVVESRCFVATWTLFAPGRGGFGGERGPGRPAPPDTPPTSTAAVSIAPNVAVLYRLLGDTHAIHVDPEAAAGIGQPRPILHGLATLAIASVALAEEVGAHPADLSELSGRFAAPVFPGETVTVRGYAGGAFDVLSERGAAVDGGTVRFA